MKDNKVRQQEIERKQLEAIMKMNLKELKKNQEIKKGETTSISVTGEDAQI